MSAPARKDQFIREYDACLKQVEATLPGANDWEKRRLAVRLLNDRLAELTFDLHLDGLSKTANTIDSRDILKQCDSRLMRLSSLSPGDELFEPITGDILGDMVGQFGVDRTRHGAYYTPRPIVQHICRESLAIFLGASFEKISDLTLTQRQSLNDKLANVRVIDPACGCGAFLVGMFRELKRWRFALVGRETADSMPFANLYGMDLDDLAVHTTKLRLILEASQIERKYADPKKMPNLIVADGLDSHNSSFDCDGFDIVVTNPPFGVSVPPEIRNKFFDRHTDGIQSRDAYALFVARSLELTKDDGVLGILMSDTWRTIRRHRPLRKCLLDRTTVHKLIDLPGWIFPATVNTGILLATKTSPIAEHQLSASDLRWVGSKDWKSLELAFDGSDHDQPTDVLSSETYSYPQTQIGDYENLSFFIASPRLHTRLSDQRFTTLGQIAKVRQGLATGDNKYYLRKRPTAHGYYRLVESALIVNEKQLLALSSDEKLNGVDPADYNGRYFVPYDKGGASDSDQGWLPNYYVPTEYFIDWSQASVKRMKSVRSARQGGKVAARFQNAAYYFRRGLTFSYTGFYAPCFRLSSGGVFDVGGSSCFDLEHPLYPTLAILCSRLTKYFARNFIDHTVNFQVDEFKALPLPREIDQAISLRLGTLVAQIVDKQHSDPRYPYHLHEQIEIDRLVYQLFELTYEDIREVEAWWSRRYSKLSRR